MQVTSRLHHAIAETNETRLGSKLQPMSKPELKMTIVDSARTTRAGSPPSDPNLLKSYLAKLERRVPLAPEEHEAFSSLAMRVVTADAKSKIYGEGAEARQCLFVLSGVLTRRKSIGGAGRIVGLSIPGDAADLQSLWFRQVDHDLVAQSPVKLLAIDHTDIIALCAAYPRAAAALWHDTLVDAAIFREWTLNIGHRRARQRIGHFLLETAARLGANELSAGASFELPLTQTDIASALGLSLVHFNKSLAALRRDRLVSMEGRLITLPDTPALAAEVGFDDGYLHVATAPKNPFGS